VADDLTRLTAEWEEAARALAVTTIDDAGAGSSSALFER
jgi:hypothetical protein